MSSTMNIQDKISAHRTLASGKTCKVEVIDLAPDYPLLRIENAFAKASIAMHGAHVTRFRPHGEDEVLWVSKQAVYEPGKAIRGGIPVCWPWFGGHPDNPALPAHGFVRNRFWQLDEVSHSEDGETTVAMSLHDTHETRQIWDYAFAVQLTITIGSSLQQQLRMTNTGDRPCNYTGALHSYFQVLDIQQVYVTGLHGAKYIDKLQHNALCHQQGRVSINGETDRVYLNVSNDHVIEDTEAGRTIHIAKQGSDSTVIWNPWQTGAARLSDFEPQGFNHMVCVEVANAADDIVRLAPGESHVLGMTVRVGSESAGHNH